jgi:hypothetical protein
MTIGMLWHMETDKKDKTTNIQQIQRALDYYLQKYSKKPNFCHVHPDFYDLNMSIEGVEIVPDVTTGKDCLWLGISET